MQLKIKAAVGTHVGKVRRNNEDNFYLNGYIRSDISQCEASYQWSGKTIRFLAAVADGMGGEDRGETASLIAVERLAPCDLAKLPDAAIDCIQEANRKICTEIEHNGGKRMGSTLAALYIDQGQAVCCNIGDSRVYHLRDGVFTQLSVDHNRAWSMVEMGVLTREQAAQHPSRHELTQHLGIFEDEFMIEPAFSAPVSLQEGDRFLLCSDGLTDMVSENQLSELLSESGSPEEQVSKLIQLALDRGGRDNITALVVQLHRRPDLFGWAKQ